MTYTESWTWTLFKAQVEESLTERGDGALLELIRAVENLGHVVGLLQLKLRESLLLLRDHWLFSRRDLVRHAFLRCRLGLFLGVRDVLQSDRSCDLHRLVVEEPEVSHLLGQVVPDKLLALDDLEDTLSYDFNRLGS